MQERPLGRVCSCKHNEGYFHKWENSLQMADWKEKVVRGPASLLCTVPDLGPWWCTRKPIGLHIQLDLHIVW